MTDTDKRVIDRLIDACITGEECRVTYQRGRRTPAISCVGLGVLSREKLLHAGAQEIVRLDAVHPDAQHRFLDVWMRVGSMLRGYINDDDLFFELLRKVLPPYRGADAVLYRGQIDGRRLEPSWTRSPHIALKFAMFGTANINLRLATKGLPSGGRDDGVVLKGVVPAANIICAPCLLGQPEGEYIIDPRAVEFTCEPATQAAEWIKREMERGLAICSG